MLRGSIEHSGSNINYTVSGRNHAPALVLLHPLGASSAVFDAELEYFERFFRVIRCDMPGHGGSSVPSQAPRVRTIADLAGDVCAVLDAQGVPRAHWCGVSIGGMIALHVAAHAPQRVFRLVPANTAAYMGPPESWDERIAKVHADGMQGIVAGVAARWFTPEFVVRQPELVERIVELVRGTDPRGYLEACAAIRDMDLRSSLAAVQAPTLLIAGARDVSTPPERAEEIRASIVGADLAVLDAGHLACVELAKEFAVTVTEFLRE